MNHFENKDPLKHVTEKQAEGIISSTEIHGAEIPGFLFAGADAARDTALFILLVWTLRPTLFSLIFLSLGWLIWKTGRSAWLGWSRLERLHRLLEEEKWEIEHNRYQEKEELKVLYAAKGFEGKLLEDVVDVLMADDERALHVMLREELGLALEAYEHPLKQALGALTGALFTIAACLAGLFLQPDWGVVIAAFIAIGVAAFLSAKWEKNRFIDAIVWNLGIAALAYGCVYLGINR